MSNIHDFIAFSITQNNILKPKLIPSLLIYSGKIFIIDPNDFIKIQITPYLESIFNFAHLPFDPLLSDMWSSSNIPLFGSHAALSVLFTRQKLDRVVPSNLVDLPLLVLNFTVENKSTPDQLSDYKFNFEQLIRLSLTKDLDIFFVGNESATYDAINSIRSWFLTNLDFELGFIDYYSKASFNPARFFSRVLGRIFPKEQKQLSKIGPKYAYCFVCRRSTTDLFYKQGALVCNNCLNEEVDQEQVKAFYRLI